MLESLPELADPAASFFDDPATLPYSCYAGIAKPELGDNQHGQKKLHIIPAGKLWPDKEDQVIPPLGEAAHDQLRGLINNEYFPCLGARAAFSQGTYRLGFYKHLGHLSSVAAMGRDLRRFCLEYDKLGDFATFLAVFKRPQISSEDDFEVVLWQHLQLLHDHDVDDWDPHYSPVPTDPNFGFSFYGKAFFVVGMHAGASRFARRFAFHTLAFNPESQIRRLKEAGLLEQFAAKVRQRDTLFQGSINPSLPTSTETTGGEARVYSGKAHRPGDGWVCPFQPRRAVMAKYLARRSTVQQ
jgi:FPC/CPF motif-containing protein YcgG